MLEIIQIGEGHYLISSLSKPGEWHCVDLEEPSCTCWGQHKHGHCWHIPYLKEAESHDRSRGPSV
jgi:hypothetical protein